MSPLRAGRRARGAARPPRPSPRREPRRRRRARTPPTTPRCEPRALTRCSAPSGGRGRRSRPSWGRSCWAWRAPPAAVSAAPRAPGPWRGAPGGAAPGEAGGGTRKGTRGAGSQRRRPGQLRRTWAARGAGRGRGWRGRARSPASGPPRGGPSEHGRPGDGQSVGRAVRGGGGVAPAANEGEAGPPPGPIPGGPRRRGPMARRGDPTCRAGRGPPGANGSARGPALPGNPRRPPTRRLADPPRRALRRLRFPSAVLALRRPGNGAMPAPGPALAGVNLQPVHPDTSRMPRGTGAALRDGGEGACGQHLRPRMPSGAWTARPAPGGLLVRRPRLRGAESPTEVGADRVQLPPAAPAPATVLPCGIREPIPGGQRAGRLVCTRQPAPSAPGTARPTVPRPPVTFPPWRLMWTRPTSRPGACSLGPAP